MRLLVCLLLVPLMAFAAGPQWKWRDASGQIQYSDRPPPAGIPDKDILQRPVTRPERIRIISTDQPASAPAAETPASAPKAPAADAAKKKAEADKKAAEKAKQEAAETENRRRKAENCEQARARLAEIDSGQRLASTDAKGEKVYWDDARRAAERQRVQAIANESCR